MEWVCSRRAHRGGHDPAWQNAAYVGVIVWEVVTGLVLAAAVVQRVRGRGQWLSTLGLAMVLALFLVGFIVIGGEWFQMWRSTAWNGLDPAFRNTVIALLTLLVLHLDGRRPGASELAGT